ncbi:MAG TPA: nucleoside-diphosphate sugar epimerase/dehydratase [Candidatus Krumholzibacteria bacterium]|nr:nucleoside-diphosphate sugar epimerase/dehydratase [Candidatus Krumholzibacteria bacterium]
MVDRLKRTLGDLNPYRDGALARLVRRHRVLFFVLFFGSIAALSVVGSFTLRFQFSWLRPDDRWTDWMRQMLLVAVPVRLLVCYLLGIHKVSWRFASLRDLPPLVWASVLGSLVITAALYLPHKGVYPRSVLIIDAVGFLVLAFIGRYAYRILDAFSSRFSTGPQTRVVVVGAGEAAHLVLEAMNTPRLNEFKPVAVVDDDPLKNNTTFHGVPVYAPVDRLAEMAAKHKAEAAILAMPSANTSQIYRVVKLAREAGLPLKTTPDIWQVLQSSEAVTRIQDFSMDDLLNRRVVRTDVPEIRELIAGRRILVTGAAGSIGSELCRQIVDQGAGRLICMDKDENGLFRLEQELRRRNPEADLVFFLGDIKNVSRVDLLFSNHKPAVVFHAAAYKHVPILQYHPVEAIRNNVGGTRNIAQAAQRHGVERFVMISTDKAVRPTSVMGATKQVAEKVIRGLGRAEPDGTRFSTIRFGNVLGSAGSVVELFIKQIRDGGPVTVTDARMERFFMTIAEAVHLVLFAATMGEGDDVFILDMGDPVKIDQLARQMIQLSGLTPDVDVEIVYTGLRPGEKLYEELWTDAETPVPTGNPGIRKTPSGQPLPENLPAEVDALLAAARADNMRESWDHLLKLVPDFQGLTRDAAEEAPDRRMQAE